MHSPTEPTRRWPHWWPLAALPLWLIALAAWRQLALPDEGRYGGVAYEMLQNGDALTPTLFGMPYFHKPPLMYWIDMAALQLLGPTKLALRIAPLLGAWIMGLALWIEAGTRYGRDGARQALAVLAVLPLFYFGGQYANHDMLVAGWISMAVVAASGLVKNLAFKTEILPFAAVAMGLVPLGVSLIFLTLLLVVDGNAPSWHIVWVPLVILLQFFFVAALGLWLSAITVFIRDVSFVLPNLLMVLMFATPVFYSIDMMPSVVQRFSEFNPLYIIVEGYRQPLIHHASPKVWALAYVAFLSLIIFYAGLKAFRRVKGNFEGVL